MKIDIYQSTKDSSKFLSVPEKTDMSNLKITEEEATIFGKVTSHRKSLNIDANDERIALNTDDVLKQIKNKGYAIHGAKIDFNVT